MDTTINIDAAGGTRDESSVFANNRNFFDNDEDEVFVRKNNTISAANAVRIPSLNVTSAALVPRSVAGGNRDAPGTRPPARQERGVVNFGQSIALQQVKVVEQDKHIEQLGATIGELRDISENISLEVDEQVLLLEEFNDAMEGHGTRLNRVMSRIEKFSQMSSDKQQWVAIFILTIVLILVVVLFIVL